MQSNNKDGFTLVEIIVVSIIVAVLAAAAIPLYNGYIQDTHQSVVDNLAQTAAAAANAYWRKTGVDPALSQLNLFYDDAKYQVLLNISSGSIQVQCLSRTSITRTVPYKN